MPDYEWSVITRSSHVQKCYEIRTGTIKYNIKSIVFNIEGWISSGSGSAMIVRNREMTTHQRKTMDKDLFIYFLFYLLFCLLCAVVSAW